LINGAFSNEVFMNAIIRLTNSSNDYDVLKDLQEVTVPNAGHAAMYEKPVLFIALLLGFVNLEQVEFMV